MVVERVEADSTTCDDDVGIINGLTPQLCMSLSSRPMTLDEDHVAVNNNLLPSRIDCTTLNGKTNSNRSDDIFFMETTNDVPSSLKFGLNIERKCSNNHELKHGCSLLKSCSTNSNTLHKTPNPLTITNEDTNDAENAINTLFETDYFRNDHNMFWGKDDVCSDVVAALKSIVLTEWNRINELRHESNCVNTVCDQLSVFSKSVTHNGLPVNDISCTEEQNHGLTKHSANQFVNNGSLVNDVSCTEEQNHELTNHSAIQFVNNGSLVNDFSCIEEQNHELTKHSTIQFVNNGSLVNDFSCIEEHNHELTKHSTIQFVNNGSLVNDFSCTEEQNHGLTKHSANQLVNNGSRVNDFSCIEEQNHGLTKHSTSQFVNNGSLVNDFSCTEEQNHGLTKHSTSQFVNNGSLVNDFSCTEEQNHGLTKHSTSQFVNNGSLVNDFSCTEEQNHELTKHSTSQFVNNGSLVNDFSCTEEQNHELTKHSTIQFVNNRSRVNDFSCLEEQNHGLTKRSPSQLVNNGSRVNDVSCIEERDHGLTKHSTGEFVNNGSRVNDVSCTEEQNHELTKNSTSEFVNNGSLVNDFSCTEEQNHELTKHSPSQFVKTEEQDAGAIMAECSEFNNQLQGLGDNTVEDAIQCGDIPTINDGHHAGLQTTSHEKNCKAIRGLKQRQTDTCAQQASDEQEKMKLFQSVNVSEMNTTQTEAPLDVKLKSEPCFEVKENFMKRPASFINQTESPFSKRQKSTAETRESKARRFQQATETLQNLGLWDVAQRTGSLLKKNKQLFSELDQLKRTTALFMQSISKNPLNETSNIESQKCRPNMNVPTLVN